MRRDTRNLQKERDKQINRQYPRRANYIRRVEEKRRQTAKRRQNEIDIRKEEIQENQTHSKAQSDAVYLKQSCTHQLIKNFTNSGHCLRSALRILLLF